MNLPRPASFAAAITAVAALVTVGCNTEPLDSVSAETGFVTYQSDSDIVVTLTNASDVRISYVTCTPRWDRKTDDGYERIPVTHGCEDEVFYLLAGESVDIPYYFPAGHPLGTWRIAILVSSDDSSDEIYTNDFEMVVKES
ncbi:MAG TPA: hypothetical protein VFS94_02340 [Gemmatimonadales bacterium]|nr:hypothetical protein [Gemmatimonadales bacterium]